MTSTSTPWARRSRRSSSRSPTGRTRRSTWTSRSSTSWARRASATWSRTRTSTTCRASWRCATSRTARAWTTSRTGSRPPSSPAGARPAYILANKQDLLDKAAFGDEALTKAAQPWSAPFAYTSARTGENVDDTFNALAIEAVNNAMRLPQGRGGPVDLDDRLLQALAQRGFLGFTKNELFQKFR